MSNQKLYTLELCDGYAWLFPTNNEMRNAEFKRLATGASAKSWWKSACLVHKAINGEASPRPVGDFPYLAPKVPVFSERARSAMAELLRDHVEFLPATLSSSSECVWIANILACPTAVDETASEFSRTRTGLIVAVRNLVCCGRQAPLFASPDLPGYYVTDDFVELMTRSGLAGVRGIEMGRSV
jgi:hypothetical protein